MEDAAPDLVKAAENVIRNMCAGDNKTAESLDLDFSAQVSTWLCWCVCAGLF